MATAVVEQKKNLYLPVASSRNGKRDESLSRITSIVGENRDILEKQ